MVVVVGVLGWSVAVGGVWVSCLDWSFGVGV